MKKLLLALPAFLVASLAFGTVVQINGGGTSAITATAARSNLSAAKSGANTDITSVASVDVNSFLRFLAQGESRYADADSSNYVGFKAPATVGSNFIWTLPAADGAAGTVLSTTSGVLSWVTAATVPSAGVVYSNGSALLSESFLDRTRGGSGISSTATFPASGVIVTEAAVETLTNKTLGSTNTLTGATAASFTSGGNTVTLPTATSTLATLALVETLTNKTMGSTNTLTGATAANFTSSGNVVTLPTATSTLATQALAETITNKSFVTDGANRSIFISGSGSNRKFVLDQSGASDSTTTTLASTATTNTRVLTLPDTTDTMVARATADTLTNKTMGSTNTLTGATASSFTNTGTVTLPTATDTLVARATTDTLTNKTINGNSNTLTVLPAQILPSGSAGNFLTSNGSTFASAAYTASDEIANLGVSASISSNTLVIALKQADGSIDATATAPVKVGFRDSTSATTGAYTQSLFTAANSITLAANDSLGANTLASIYVYLISDTTSEICASSSVFEDGTRQSASALTAGADTSNTVIWCTSAHTSKPLRLVGMVSATWSNPNWSAITTVKVLPFRPDEFLIGTNLNGGTYANGSQNIIVGGTGTAETAFFIGVGNATSDSTVFGGVQFANTASGNTLKRAARISAARSGGSNNAATLDFLTATTAGTLTSGFMVTDAQKLLLGNAAGGQAHDLYGGLNFVSSGATAPSTGIYSNASNALGIVTNGTLAASISSAQVFRIGPTSIPSGAYPGQNIVGVTDGTQPCTGCVGERIEKFLSRSNRKALTDNGLVNVTASTDSGTDNKMSLTNGEWEVTGLIGIVTAGTTQLVQANVSISQTTQTLPSSTKIADPSQNEGYLRSTYPTSYIPGGDVWWVIPPFPVSVSGTQDYYLVGQVDIAGVGASAEYYGYMRARRVR